MCWRIGVVDNTTEIMMMDLTSVSDQEQNITLTDQDLESEMKDFLEDNRKRRDTIKYNWMILSCVIYFSIMLQFRVSEVPERSLLRLYSRKELESISP